MHIKIKKHFLRIFFSFFAVMSAFILKGFFDESSNLKNMEDSSKKVLEGVGNLLDTGVANADVVTSACSANGDNGCSAGAGNCDGCSDGLGCGLGGGPCGSGGGTGGGGGAGDVGCDGETCFIAGQKVTMVDGTFRNIEDVVIGEKVKGEGGIINTVMGYERPIIGSRKTYVINGMVEFTGDHPFLSNVGWKVADLDLFHAFPRELPTPPTKLAVGDKLFTQDQDVLVTIETLEVRNDRPAEEVVYDLKLDGDHTYTVEGLIVHNC